MAIYDPHEQRLVVRVVYDGVACAGKTTNLRQLCGLFAARRGIEVHTPAELHGRTLFFDWMQISAGLVCGYPLLCQLITVPGQLVLTPRRARLLATADVVVYVCDSHPGSVAASRAGLELYEGLVPATAPIVVQANKQDQLGALGGAALLEALGRGECEVVEAIATEGVGVVDTYVMAVRSVARVVQARVASEALRLPVRRAESAAALLAQLTREQLEPEWAAEMVLEEAYAAMLFEEARAAIASDVAARAQAEAALADLRPEPAPALDAGGPAAPPTLPSPDVPTGFIWPAHTGRATLRSLNLSRLSLRAFDGRGTLELSAHGYVARTSLRARFSDGEAARQALVRSARELVQLDRLHVADTVLVAQAAEDGACWIWTVRPEVPPLAELLAQGAAPPGLLAAYGEAFISAVRVSRRHGYSVDLTPTSFGSQGGEIRYVGEITPSPLRAEDVQAALAKAVELIHRAGVDPSAFLDGAERLAGAQARDALPGASPSSVAHERLRSLTSRAMDAAP